MPRTVLHIDCSIRPEGSVTRDLSAQILARLAPETVIRRDLMTALPVIDAEWLGANVTANDQRSDAHRQALALSDSLIAELRAADVVVIGMPIYNFSVPTSLKTWIDLVCRAGETFRYGEAGPQGLLEGKRAIIALASGGTAVGSDIDFASGYMRHIMGFIGITDVEIIAADRMAVNADASLASANAAIDRIAA